jgi:hypothetical protein
MNEFKGCAITMLNTFLLMLIALLAFSSEPNAATVWTEQKGTFKQCTSPAGAKKYNCIEGTGCPADTLKCVPPVVVPPPTCQAPKTGVYPDCGECVAPKVGVYPACTDPVPPVATCGIVQVGLMPKVDTCKNITPAVGYNAQRIKPTTEQAPVKSEGAFRISCLPSHMNNDDPMVFPNQQGATHHHTYYGNTSVDYKTNLDSVATTGNSTCNGGTMNRSAYWHPTMIDTSTNAPVLPDQGVIFYYKNGWVPANLVTVPPAKLRMLAGNPRAVNASEASAAKYVCINYATQNSNGMPWQKTIPNCGTDTYLQMVVEFPQCWDGLNLDSPNHKDHMAYPGPDFGTANRCPTSHKVPIPVITLNMNYKIQYNGQAAKWRLASDNYANTSPGGYSGHADWVNGWDQPTLTGIVRNCLNPSKDAHAHLLCDGRQFYGAE